VELWRDSEVSERCHCGEVGDDKYLRIEVVLFFLSVLKNNRVRFLFVALLLLVASLTLFARAKKGKNGFFCSFN
jgi:hypothetical protein